MSIYRRKAFHLSSCLFYTHARAAAAAGENSQHILRRESSNWRSDPHDFSPRSPWECLQSCFIHPSSHFDENACLRSTSFIDENPSAFMQLRAKDDFSTLQQFKFPCVNGFGYSASRQCVNLYYKLPVYHNSNTLSELHPNSFVFSNRNNGFYPAFLNPGAECRARYSSFSFNFSFKKLAALSLNTHNLLQRDCAPSNRLLLLSSSTVAVGSWNLAKIARNLHYEASKKKDESKLREYGWTIEELTSSSNLISSARLLSGPYLALLIFQDNLNYAFFGLILAGISDWLDGYVARRQKIVSVFGSYLDPLADKVLIGCVCMAMFSKNLIPSWLIYLILSRDVALFFGAFISRAHSLSWKWNGFLNFFKINNGGAQIMKPSFISKVNTVLQLILVCYALIKPSIINYVHFDFIPILSYSVAFTTLVSWGGYISVAITKNKLGF